MPPRCRRLSPLRTKAQHCLCFRQQSSSYFEGKKKPVQPSRRFIRMCPVLIPMIAVLLTQHSCFWSNCFGVATPGIQLHRQHSVFIGTSTRSIGTNYFMANGLIAKAPWIPPPPPRPLFNAPTNSCRCSSGTAVQRRPYAHGGKLREILIKYDNGVALTLRHLSS